MKQMSYKINEDCSIFNVSIAEELNLKNLPSYFKLQSFCILIVSAKDKHLAYSSGRVVG